MSGPFLSVPVKTNLSNEEFQREHVLAQQPVLIKGVLNDWNALRWTPEYLKCKAGARKIRYRTQSGTVSANFGEMIDLIFSSQGAGGAPVPYLRNVDLAAQLPELLPDISPEPVYTRNNWRSNFLMLNHWPREVRKGLFELFVSRTDASFPYLHIDYWGMSGFIAQLVGEKEVILFPRDDAANLYPTAENRLVSEIKDFDNLDDPRYPKLKTARQYRVTIGSGDLLFNPAWWHTTQTTKTSMTLIWAYWNRHEWRHLVKEVRVRCGIKGLVLAPYCRFVGLCNRLTR